MPFSAWNEDDPLGSDPLSSVDDAIKRQMIRIRERLATVFHDWTTATDRITSKKIFADSTDGVAIRKSDDSSTLLEATNAGIISIPLQLCCALTKTTQTFTDGTEAAITWDTETFDVGALHDTGSNPNRVTIPTAGTGKYLVSYIGLLTPSATAVRFRLRKNGSTVMVSQELNPISVSDARQVQLTLLLALVPTDYIEILVLSAGGNSTVANNCLSVIKLT